MDEIVLNDKIELKNYAKIEEIDENKYAITFEFTKPVIINFECPNLFWYNFINSTENVVADFFIKARDITFTELFFATKKIYAENITTKSTLGCDEIVASNNIVGYDVRSKTVKARNINLKYLYCKELACSNELNADIFVLNNIELENVCAKHIKTIK